MSSEDEFFEAVKKPVTVEARGPYHTPREVETLEGDFEVDEEYIEQHNGYYIIRGVEGEKYPCGADIFNETYRVNVGMEDEPENRAPIQLNCTPHLLHNFITALENNVRVLVKREQMEDAKSFAQSLMIIQAQAPDEAREIMSERTRVNPEHLNEMTEVLGELYLWARGQDDALLEWFKEYPFFDHEQVEEQYD